MWVLRLPPHCPRCFCIGSLSWEHVGPDTYLCCAHCGRRAKQEPPQRPRYVPPVRRRRGSFTVLRKFA